jgi:hypothetical protein
MLAIKRSAQFSSSSAVYGGLTRSHPLNPHSSGHALQISFDHPLAVRLLGPRMNSMIDRRVSTVQSLASPTQRCSWSRFLASQSRN